MPATKGKNKTLEYKGQPLRRKDNLVYYGKMSDKYIIKLDILDSRQFNDLKLATKVAVYLEYTDPDLSTRSKIVQKSEKSSFYEAIDLAAIWLERALAS